MKASIVTTVLFATAVAMGPAKAQENTGSAKYMVPLCRTWLRMLSRDVSVIENEINSAISEPGGVPIYFIKAGMCAGEVVGISQMLPDACVPKTVTYEQLVSVVVTGIEKSPEQINDSFSVLAGVALGLAWPCTKH
jgi:Rap1a immunity proteins